MSSKPIIFLASRSKRRKELLKEACIHFRVVRSNYQEKTYPGGPAKTVVINAIGKAKRANIRFRKGLILGADTIVYFRKKLIGKPTSKKAAFRMLKSLSGSSHEVYTGIALFNLETGKWKTASVRSKVKMRKLSDERVRYYLRKTNPLDKAGAYAIQEYGDELIEKIEGSYSNVVGLPMEKLKTLIRN